MEIILNIFLTKEWVNMYKYELKKIINNKFFIISTALLFLLFFYMITQYESEIDFKANQKFYSSLPKSVNEQTAKKINDKSNELLEIVFEENSQNEKGEFSDTIMGDFVIYQKASSQFDYVFTDFKQDRIKLIEDFQSNEKLAKSQNKKFESSYYQKASEIYNNVITPEIVDSEAIDAYFNFFHGKEYNTFNGLFFIIWVAFVSVYCYTGERNFKTNDIIYSCKNGREKLYFNKTLAIICIVFFVEFLFFTIEILLGIFKFKISDYFFTPIQSVQSLKMCMYNFNIFESIVVMNAMKFLTSLFVVFVSGFFSVKAKNILRPLTLTFIFFIGLSSLTLYLGSQTKYEMISKYNFLRNFSPVALTDSLEYLKSYDFGNLFGTAHNRLFVCIIFTIIISLICMLISANLYGKDGLPLWKKKA